MSKIEPIELLTIYSFIQQILVEHIYIYIYMPGAGDSGFNIDTNFQIHNEKSKHNKMSGFWDSSVVKSESHSIVSSSL